MGEKHGKPAERGANDDPGSTDPIQELKDAATSARLLRARIEDAQEKERAPVLRDPTHRPDHHDDHAVKDDQPVRKAV